MVDTVYIETEVRDHPRTHQILQRLKHAEVFEIGRYGEVFNPKAQNFRLQKANPALIIARKHDGHVLPAPDGYGVGGAHNYYFSHMLNCLYDCRYCFLQGMYNSAHQVVFVNYEDFAERISATAAKHAGEETWFFSGYDCDSLAYEPVTGFVDYHLDVFDKLDNAWLEIRTKSTQIRRLLEREPNQRVVCAFSFTDAVSHAQMEAGVPSIDKRIDAISRLTENGWLLGLRFDPVVYHVEYQREFTRLLERVFTRIDPSKLHSVSLGGFRLPKANYKRIAKLYPDEALFTQRMDLQQGMMAYPAEQEQDMLNFCEQAILSHVPQHAYFPCDWSST